MNSFVFGERSRANLIGVHPDLILVVSRGLLYSSVDFAVTEGVRTMARQWKLFNADKSKTLHSKHLRNPKTDLAHAVDVMAVGDLDGDGDIDAQDRARAWDRSWYGEIAKAMDRGSNELGIPIKWGGSFKSWYDGPHFQLAER